MMEATENIGYMGRIKLPEWICNKAHIRFSIEMGLLFNKDLFENDTIRAIIYNRITLYQSSLLVLSFQPDNKEVNEWYQKQFGTVVDLDRLKDELERLRYRYKELKKDTKPSNRTFEELISSVEIILNHAIDRGISIYEFVHLYNNAIKKAK